MGRWLCVAVCGPRQATEAQRLCGERLGSAIAHSGCALVCGGLGGVMEAAARGARTAPVDGQRPPVIAILPGEDVAQANPYCDVVVPSGLGVARNVLVVRTADAVILCGGGSGTLSEAALAWQLGKPVSAVTASGGWAATLAGRAIDSSRSDRIHAATTPEGAVRWVLEALQ